VKERWNNNISHGRDMLELGLEHWKDLGRINIKIKGSIVKGWKI
jgi:hypothetical protein